MEEIKQAIANAIEAQAEDDAVGWFARWPDGRLGLEYDDFDIGVFIAGLEAAGYRIEPVPPGASALEGPPAPP